jgi:hypothetical protein
MIQKTGLFFTKIFSREPLPLKGVDVSHKQGSFLSDLLHAEKLPEYPIRQESAGRFLSCLLACEKLPVSKTRQDTGRDLMSNVPTPEKIPSRIIPQ